MAAVSWADATGKWGLPSSFSPSMFSQQPGVVSGSPDAGYTQGPSSWGYTGPGADSSNAGSNFQFLNYNDKGVPSQVEAKTGRTTGSIFDLVPDAQGNLVPQYSKDQTWNTNSNFFTDLASDPIMAAGVIGTLSLGTMAGLGLVGGETAWATAGATAGVDAGAFGGATSAAESLIASGGVDAATAGTVAGGTTLTDLAGGSTIMNTAEPFAASQVAPTAAQISAASTGGGGADWMKTLFETGGNLGALGNMAQLASGVYGLTQAGKTNQIAQKADPFAAARPQFAQAAVDLLKDPSSITKTPGYAAGMQAVERGAAAGGYLGSGNLAAALQKYGGDFFMQQLQMFANLGGAGVNPVSAGQLALNAQQESMSTTLSSLFPLLAGVGGLWNKFGPG